MDILGDFNMHIDLPELPASRQFINLIDGAGFQQHVNSPTHNRGVSPWGWVKKCDIDVKN